MIALNQLCFGYPRSKVTLFDNLEMELPAGTICGLLGPNGAGKSTLLKIVAGLIFPGSGSCKVLGQDPARRDPALLADIFLLPEDVALPPMNGAAYELRHGCFYPRFDHAQFRELLREFELDAGQRLDTLSQGQKKKFVLAFGIASNTRLLIMDEPTNGLDIPSKSQFRRILLKHWDEQRSFLISTHQVHDLDGLIDSVAIISDGNILLHDALEDISRRYLMTLETKKPDDALHFEETLTGYAVVRENHSGEDNQPDLGLLYGLVTRKSIPTQSHREA